MSVVSLEEASYGAFKTGYADSMKWLTGWLVEAMGTESQHEALRKLEEPNTILELS